jgi:preprotein translocase subunit YajC
LIGVTVPPGAISKRVNAIRKTSAWDLGKTFFKPKVVRLAQRRPFSVGKKTPVCLKIPAQFCLHSFIEMSIWQFFRQQNAFEPSMTNLIFPFLLGQAEGPPPGGMLMQFLPLILLFAGMWFLIIAPQRKRQKEHKAMLESLQAGDEVITSGGLYATIVKVKEDRLVARIADDTRVELNKGFIQSRVAK